MRYLRNKTITYVGNRASESPCWKALLSVKETYLVGRQVILNMGDIVRLWLDRWLNDIALCSAFPLLFYISLAQEVTFQNVLQCDLNIPFSRRLSTGLLEQWNKIKNAVVLNPRVNIPEKVVWSLTPNKVFLQNLCTNSLKETLLGLIINGFGKLGSL
jgi:hypothetical protein